MSLHDDQDEPVIGEREARYQIVTLAAALGVIVALAVVPRCEREAAAVPPPAPQQVESGPWVVEVDDHERAAKPVVDHSEPISEQLQRAPLAQPQSPRSVPTTSPGSIPRSSAAATRAASRT